MPEIDIRANVPEVHFPNPVDGLEHIGHGIGEVVGGVAGAAVGTVAVGAELGAGVVVDGAHVVGDGARFVGRPFDLEGQIRWYQGENMNLRNALAVDHQMIVDLRAQLAAVSPAAYTDQIKALQAEIARLHQVIDGLSNKLAAFHAAVAAANT